MKLQASQFPPPCRPDAATGIQAIRSNQATWGALRALAPSGYAGDEPDPRPMRPVNLGDYKRGLVLSEDTLARSWGVPEALWWAFASEVWSWDLQDGVLVSPSELWWLVAPGDTALLTDRRVHHYTEIGELDRERERVSFRDPWPERFLPFRRALDIDRLSKGKAPVVSRTEFERMVLGIVTIDTPMLVDAFLAAHPERRADPEFLLRASLQLLAPMRDRFAAAATSYLAVAWRAQLMRDESDALRIAAPYFMALQIAQRSDHDRRPIPADHVPSPFADEIRDLETRYGVDALLDHLEVDDLGRLGYACARSGDMAHAEAFLDRGVDKGPQDEAIREVRAKVRFRLGKFEACLLDIEAALKANQGAEHAVQASLAERDPRDRMGIGNDKSQLQAIASRRAALHGLRGSTLLQLNRAGDGLAEVDAMVALAPADPEAFALRALLLRTLGETDQAKAALQQAMSLQPNPKMGSGYEHAWRELDRQGAKA